MRQQFSVKMICLALLLTLGFALLPVAHVQAQSGKKPQQRTDQSAKQERALTATQAAARARAHFGGKVLKVTPSGNGYRVKMLSEDGRVRTVTIKD